ncbi:MAG: LemA family protein [Planctomycetota bacterium]|jgi:LemA protein|nr:LemA family protein [Planctomycetota bacterium]
MVGLTVGLLVAAGICVLLLFYLVSIYNNLVSMRHRYKNAFAQIDVQLKRRYDLIPNLVETAKGYMKHEKETLEAVIRARNTAMSAGQQAAANPGDAQSMQNLSTAEVALAGTMTKFIGLAEAYPDLKANQNMLAIQEELTSTENKISYSRQAFNDAVTSYNIACEVFPGSLVAGFGRFERASLLEAISAPQEREAVKVQF